MTLGSRDASILLVLLLIIPISLFSCKNNQPAPVTKAASAPDTSRTKVQEIMLENESKIEANISALMQLIKEKEAELQKAEQELKEKSALLKEKEEQLAKVEHELNVFRTVTYLILVVGLVLFIIGLVLIRSKNRAAKTATQSDASHSSA